MAFLMIKNNLKINNPFTVIAIFSMLTEASAAVSLPYIDIEHQNIYIWFLVVFPTLLVTLFFLTLNFNNKTLYTPSDLSKADSHPKTTTYTPAAYAGQTLTFKSTKVPALACSRHHHPGTSFHSFSPPAFTFLPQGHRTYDSTPTASNWTNNTSANRPLPKYVLIESSAFKNIHLLNLSHPPLQRLNNTSNILEALHTHCKTPHKHKNNTSKNDLLFLLTNRQSDIPPETLKRSIALSKNLLFTSQSTVITYNTDTHILNIVNPPSLSINY